MTRENALPVRRGRFITFEGGEGAGKSTQVARLTERLWAAGIPALATREPGGAPHAEQLRRVLLSGAASHLGPLAEAILFTAARIDHVDTTIAPALTDGTFVVCDRFIDSTRAYQGALGHVDPASIAALEKIAIGACRPDLTVLIDLPAETGLARAAARRGQSAADRFEHESLSFHQLLRAAFLSIARADPSRFLIVDGAAAPTEIADEIWAAVSERLLRASGAAA